MDPQVLRKNPNWRAAPFNFSFFRGTVEIELLEEWQIHQCATGASLALLGSVTFAELES